ncbi:MAG: Ppx/GppA family phosphatase [Gammaproteobacteria bacterium]|nr:Ppx/GppA family phosphatase [Gammaproteobacteria bacterium]
MNHNDQQSSQIESDAEDGPHNYAAVDLGSNSFHLVISRYEHGEFTVIDRQREVVRLAGGLDENNFLIEEVAERALNCLRKFAQLLRSIPGDQVRVVGTNALRRMHDKHQFLEAAESALGHSIEIIAGREEARLIYLGVSKWSVSGEDDRLVIDIGGGSTEVIAGKGDIADCRESLEVGCVTQSRLFFNDGKLSRSRFDRAGVAAKLAIQPVVKQFRTQGWSRVIGCSGTMRSLETVLIAGGWSKDGIHRKGLERLLEHVIKVGHIDRLNISGLSKDRTPVFPGGLSVLMALFELFDITEMSVSDIALREGVLYDLVGRSSAEDIRDVTIAAMLNRWSVQGEHGDKVRDTALNLYHRVANSWDIDARLYREILGWSAQLHELGLLISHDGYHHHGAYLVANADMAGFARRDQLLLASMIEGHRRKFPLQRFEQLPSKLVTPAKRIAVILRLAVLLHRGRGPDSPKVREFSAQGSKLALRIDDQWIADNPLTLADLNQERSWLKAVGFALSFS